LALFIGIVKLSFGSISTICKSPLYVFLLFNIFVVSLPGVLYLFFLNETVASFSHYGLLKEDTISTVTFLFIYSIFILFLSIPLLKLCKFNQIAPFRDGETGRMNKTTLFLLLIVQFLFLMIGLIVIGFDNIPILHLFRGDLMRAQVLKAEILTGVIPSNIPYLGILFKLYILFLPAYLCNLLLFTRGREGILPVKLSILKAYFYLSFLITFVYLTHQAHKGPLVLYLLMLFSIKLFYRKFDVKLLFFVLCTFIVLILFFYFSYDISNIEGLFQLFFNRAFLSQNFGMYLIYQWVEPDVNSAFHGIPFVKNFMVLSARADEIVMVYLNGGHTDGNVNMNTFFLGEAYSAFGLVGAVIAPFLVVLVLLVTFAFYSFGARINSTIFFPLLYIHLFFFFPLNQTFNRIIYFTESAFVFFFTVFILLLVNIFHKKSKQTGYS
jgi:hypothetical protein